MKTATPKPPPPIGSLGWWYCSTPFALRGVIECILRLLEQQRITRRKAVGLVRYAMRGYVGEAPPSAPWDELDWGDGSE